MKSNVVTEWNVNTCISYRTVYDLEALIKWNFCSAFSTDFGSNRVIPLFKKAILFAFAFVHASKSLSQLFFCVISGRLCREVRWMTSFHPFPTALKRCLDIMNYRIYSLIRRFAYKTGPNFTVRLSVFCLDPFIRRIRRKDHLRAHGKRYQWRWLTIGL